METRIKSSVRPEPVEGLCYGLIVIDLIRSWFDKLTTNGLNLRFLIAGVMCRYRLG